MIAIPERVAFIVLIGFSGFFIVTGFAMIGMGIKASVSPPERAAVDEDAKISSGTSTILSGCFDIVIGACGLVGAILKKRVFLLAYACLLGFAILANIILLIQYTVAGTSAPKKVKDSIMENLISRYGNNSNDDFKKFEKEINEQHKEDTCCGWSDDEADNIYLKTPWYKGNNVQGIVRTVPDSCCLKMVDECHSTQNMKDAREKGFVMKDDCLSRILGRMKVFFWLALLQIIIVTLLQLALVTFSVLYFLQLSQNDMGAVSSS